MSTKPSMSPRGGTPTGHDRYGRTLRALAERLRRRAEAAPGDPDAWSFLQGGLDEALLGEIEAAERRVESGAFGICAECGERIATKRLEALPWARFCARCQDILSTMNRHLG